MAAARDAASTPLVPHCFALSSCRSCGDRRRGAAAHSVSAAGAALRAACRMWPPLASRALPEPAGDGHVVALESRRQAARSPPSDTCRCPAVAGGAGGVLQAPEPPPCLPQASLKRLVPSQTRSVCVSTCWRTCGGSLGRPTLRPFPTWSAAEPAVMPAPDVTTIERGGSGVFIIMCVRLKKSFFLHLLLEPTRCELRGLAIRATNLTIPKQVGSGWVLPQVGKSLALHQF